MCKRRHIHTQAYANASMYKRTKYRHKHIHTHTGMRQLTEARQRFLFNARTVGRVPVLSTRSTTRRHEEPWAARATERSIPNTYLTSRPVFFDAQSVALDYDRKSRPLVALSALLRVYSRNRGDEEDEKDEIDEKDVNVLRGDC